MFDVRATGYRSPDSGSRLSLPSLWTFDLGHSTFDYCLSSVICPLISAFQNAEEQLRFEEKAVKLPNERERKGVMETLLSLRLKWLSTPGNLHS